jgi:hypothetical protein
MTSYRCPYCNKSYTRESWYDKHKLNCEKLKRFEQIHRMDFRRGLQLFNHWRVRNGFVHRGKTITAEKFINHWMYKSFMKLVRFTSENWVITSVRYLDFMIDHHVGDAKWCNEETLKLYREYIRRTEDPISQSKITCQIISDWCRQNQIDRKEFFAKIPPGQAFQMIAANRLSPWVLFGYDRSVQDLLSRVNDDWLSSVNEIINNKYWINKITECDTVQQSIQAECERSFSDE